MSMKVTLIAAALAAGVALSGCQLSGGSSSSSSSSYSASADPRLQSAAVEVKGSSYMTSCLAGMGVAALGVLLTGNDNKKNLAIAAAAGCAVGMGGNYLLDSLRKDYAEKERQLDSLIGYLSESNNKAALMAANAKTVYEERHKSIQKLVSDYNKGKAQKSQIEKSIAENNANIKVLDETIKAHTQALDGYRTARDGIASDNGGTLSSADRRALRECDKKIALLESQIAEIRSSLLSMSKDNDVLLLTASGKTRVDAA